MPPSHRGSFFPVQMKYLGIVSATLSSLPTGFLVSSNSTLMHFLVINDLIWFSIKCLQQLIVFVLPCSTQKRTCDDTAQLFEGRLELKK